MAQTTRRSWTKAGASRAAIQRIKVLGPYLRGAKYAQDRHRRCGFGIYDDVVGPDHQLPPARAAAF